MKTTKYVAMFGEMIKGERKGSGVNLEATTDAEAIEEALRIAKNTFKARRYDSRYSGHHMKEVTVAEVREITVLTPESWEN